MAKVSVMTLLPSLEWKGSRVWLRPPAIDDIDALIAFQRDNHERFAVSDPTRPDALYTASFWQERLRRIDADVQARRGLYQLVFAQAAPSRLIGTVIVGGMTGAPGEILASKKAGSVHRSESPPDVEPVDRDVAPDAGARDASH